MTQENDQFPPDPQGHFIPAQVDLAVAEQMLSMQAELQALRSEMTAMRQNRGRQTEHPESPTPRFRVFPIGAASAGFIEQVPVGGKMYDLNSPQARTGDLLTPGGFAIEMEDGYSKVYLPIGIVPLLITDPPSQPDPSVSFWNYNGTLLKAKTTGGYDLTTFTGLRIVNDMELASIAGTVGNAVLDGTHQQIGALNSSITSDCKVLPFRPGAIVHCYLGAAGIYHFSQPNTIAPA